MGAGEAAFGFTALMEAAEGALGFWGSGFSGFGPGRAEGPDLMP